MDPKSLSRIGQKKVRELLEDGRPFEAISRVQLSLGVDAAVAWDIVDAVRRRKPHAQVSTK